MSVNFEYYKVFYVVGKFGNITMAAKSLYLTQSTVSRIIQNLEHELGTKLFVRSKKGVVLTDTGTVLYNHVSQACEHIYRGEQRVSLMKDLSEGTLRIGTTEVIMQFFLMSMIRPFHEKHPGVKIDISFHDPSSVSAALNSGLLDLAILTSPIDQDERIEVLPWMSFDDVFVTGSTYPELREGEYSMPELAEYPVVAMRSGMSARTYLEGLFINAGLELKPSFEVQSLPFILKMVENGLGIACVPDFYIKESVNEGTVFQISLKENLPEREICAVISKIVPGSLIRDEFLKMIME